MTNFIKTNWDAFSHGQILSKLWLCETLEQFLPNSCSIAILGSWYNILGFMLKVRGNQQTITAYDLDPAATNIADKITNCWSMSGPIINKTADVNTIDLSVYQVIINTSCEHMSDQWFMSVTPGTLVCLQSSNLDIATDPWLISNPSTTIESFVKKFPMAKSVYQDKLSIDYATWGYERYMKIGYK